MKAPGKNLLSLIPGLIFAGLGFLAVFQPGFQFPFTEAILAGKERRLEGTRLSIAQIAAENRQLSEELVHMQAIRSTAARETGVKAQALLRERLEACINQAGVQIRTMGDVRTNPLSEDAIAYELSLAADCQVEELDQLLFLLARGMPRLYWKSFAVRTNTHTPGRLQLNGTVSLLSFPAGDEDE